MPEGCSCEALCFPCAAATVGKKRIGRPIDGREQACLYWSERIGGKPGEVHPTVREAVYISPSLCERAWGRLRDKEMDAANPDLTQAVKVQNRRAYFIWALKELIAEAYKEQHERKMRQSVYDDNVRAAQERKQAAINRRVYRK